jgi:general stress protein YciG
MPYDDILRIAERDDDDPPEAPDLPTDEPKPAPVQDPPAEPDTTPYVVGGTEGPGPFLRESTMNDSEQARNAGERRERRGFASMSPEKQREIASKGGRAAHQKGTAHEWTSEEARSAGRKGGQISRGGRGRLVDGTGSEPSDAPHRAEYNTPVSPERFGE